MVTEATIGAFTWPSGVTTMTEQPFDQLPLARRRRLVFWAVLLGAVRRGQQRSQDTDGGAGPAAR